VGVDCVCSSWACNMAELSPAVERMEEAVAKMSANSSTRRLGHWLLALLDDEDGHPASLLERMQFDRETILAQAQATLADTPPSPAVATLHGHARELAIQLRGETRLTTDILFLAVLTIDFSFGQAWADAGLDPQAVAEAIRLPRQQHVQATPSPEFTVGVPPEHKQAGRVIDANLNRCREGLRVLDDYCRFVLDDRTLTEHVKSLRHGIAEATRKLPPGLLLAARDTTNDVGTDIVTESEYRRTSAAHVAEVNVKRVQESLRSLEEFGKVLDGGFAKQIEQIRYLVYTLEAAIARTANPLRAKLQAAHLYMLLTGSQCVAALDWTIREAAAGGVGVFQMREKDKTDRELIERAKQLRRWTRETNTLFIVNDRPDIAVLVEADGIHVGQDDLSIAAVRRIVGAEMLIGVSTHIVEQVQKAVREGADYLGVGPVFPSSTKVFDELAGLEFVREASSLTQTPMFALGGITPENLHEVILAGATRVAVSSALSTVDDPQRVAAAFAVQLSAAAVVLN
jgi:thiamine-phosphate pyrophosphorylase